MKQIKTILFITVFASFFAGCSTRETESNRLISISSSPTPTTYVTVIPSPAISVTPSPTAFITSVSEQITITEEEKIIDLTLYLYGPDDYDNPSETKVISVNKSTYENNLVEALNTIFEDTEIVLTSAVVDNKSQRLTVDISEEVCLKFNAGSCGGAILTNELIDTLLNLPNIQSVVVTVDGAKDSIGDHYSFEGVFTKDEK